MSSLFMCAVVHVFFMRNEAAQRSMRKSFGHVWWRYSLVQVEIEISAGRR